MSRRVWSVLLAGVAVCAFTMGADGGCQPAVKHPPISPTTPAPQPTQVFGTALPSRD